MDLSQQELPLTTFFTRGEDTVHKKDKKVPQSVARSSKRKRNNVSTSRSVGQSESRSKALQLPTPAASTRKRVRGEYLEDCPTSPGASVERKGPLSRKKDFAQLNFGPTPSKSSLPSDLASELPSASLATPSTGRRRTTKTLSTERLPGPRLSSHVETGIATPGASSQRSLELKHHAGHSPSVARSDCASLSKPKASVLVSRDSPSAFLSNTTDGQSSNGHIVPMFPVPSSQSQYLLHLDATPKRKRHLQGLEHVISSQTQEEKELTLSSSLKSVPVAMVSLGASPGKHILSTTPQTPRPHRSLRKSQRAHIHGSSPSGSPMTLTSPSRSFTTQKVSLEHSPEFSSPPRRKASTCQNPIDSVWSAQQEDSVTEPESEGDIFRDSHHSQVSRDKYPLNRRDFAQGNLPGMDDDSTTEAESDTEILHCVAEICKKRPPQCRSKVSEENAPPSPVISPLVTPAKSRTAAMPPPPMSLTQFSAQENSKLRFQDLCAPHLSTVDQSRARSESLPSVVRDFIRMFPGDESYPADFPESLRV